MILVLCARPSAKSIEQAQKNGMKCGALTHDEEQLQMAIWSMSAAPLLMSTDVGAISQASIAGGW